MHLRSLSLKLVVTRFVCNGAYVVGYGSVHQKLLEDLIPLVVFLRWQSYWMVTTTSIYGRYRLAKSRADNAGLDAEIFAYY